MFVAPDILDAGLLDPQCDVALRFLEVPAKVREGKVVMFHEPFFKLSRLVNFDGHLVGSTYVGYRVNDGLCFPKFLHRSWLQRFPGDVAQGTSK